MAQWQRGVPPIKIVAASDLRPSTSTAQHTTSNRFLTRQSLRTDPLNSSNINVGFSYLFNKNYGKISFVSVV